MDVTNTFTISLAFKKTSYAILKRRLIGYGCTYNFLHWCRKGISEQKYTKLKPLAVPIQGWGFKPWCYWFFKAFTAFYSTSLFSLCCCMKGDLYIECRFSFLELYWPWVVGALWLVVSVTTVHPMMHAKLWFKVISINNGFCSFMVAFSDNRMNECPRAIEVILGDMGKINHYLTRTKHNTARFACICFGAYFLSGSVLHSHFNKLSNCAVFKPVIKWVSGVFHVTICDAQQNTCKDPLFIFIILPCCLPWWTSANSCHFAVFRSWFFWEIV